MNHNGFGSESVEYDTPFNDIRDIHENEHIDMLSENLNLDYLEETDSPFSKTYEFNNQPEEDSIDREEFVDLLSELKDHDFNESLYGLVNEVEDAWLNKVSNEIAMGKNFIPFVTQQANEYFSPLIFETEKMIDTVADHFSGNNLADYTDNDVESYFTNLEFNHDHFTPAQEQFFGKIFKKVKSAVKKGVKLAKKGIRVVNKLLPTNIILKKIKKLVRPLLNKVLKFAIGKLPKKFRPYAQTLAKKFLNLETEEEAFSEYIDHENDLDAIQMELDYAFSSLVFSENEEGAEYIINDYETSFENLERTDNYESGYSNSNPSLNEARQILINEFKNLQPDQDPGPAIQNFIPAAIMALRPVIKIALKIIGRQKVVNFLAGLIAKLVKKFIPANVAKPLSAKIVDIGLKTIGFEVDEGKKVDLAYEALVNTIQETIQNLTIDESDLDDEEKLTSHLLEAFENAVSNNFPPDYIKEEFRPTHVKGFWIGMPRKSSVKRYKKYTHIFNVSINPQLASAVKIYRGLPLANFLRDKYGISFNKPINARVHLYETNTDGRLSHIGKLENLPGLNAHQPRAWIQLLPLTKQAANLLLDEPSLGKNIDPLKISDRYKTLKGQRYYYLEIEGTKLRIPPINRAKYALKGNKTPSPTIESRSADIQCILDFNRSEIKINYFFSEEDAKSLVSKLNQNKFISASLEISNSIKNVFTNILRNNISSKIKIIHEYFPELYLSQINNEGEEFSFIKHLGKISENSIISSLVKKLVGLFSNQANKSIYNFFKTRALEFKNAQALPQDGVTVKIIWKNISGMSALKTIIGAIKGRSPINTLSNLSIPDISSPDIIVVADKSFE